MGGFAHAQVLALADQVVEAVRRGAIRKFVVMAGCDGRARSREYYRNFAKALPKDSVILTAGCAKYKYNKLNLGDIGGIPRVLDAGQCNDSYSLAPFSYKYWVSRLAAERSIPPHRQLTALDPPLAFC